MLKVERLNPEQIAQLSEAMLGQIGSEPQIVEFLQRETEGNIFFLIEVVRSLADEAGERRADRLRHRRMRGEPHERLCARSSPGPLSAHGRPRATL